MKKTIAQTKIDAKKSEGHELLGTTSGQLSLRKGSNLARKLESLGLTAEDVIIETGARAGRYATEGYQLLIFKK